MTERRLLYEGKAKRIFAFDSQDEYIVFFKDDATAFNAQKKGQWQDKGVVNNSITSHIYPLLEEAGIPTHFIKKLNESEQLVKAVKIIPVEVIVRNVAAGSFSKRLGIKEGTKLKNPVVEYCFKSDALGDPMINTDTVLALELATKEEINTIRELALKVCDFLLPYLKECNIKLIDFKLEFGRLKDGTVVLADEISPDTCRFWDLETNEKMDKDRFRRDLGGEQEAYKEILKRITSK